MVSTMDQYEPLVEIVEIDESEPESDPGSNLNPATEIMSQPSSDKGTSSQRFTRKSLAPKPKAIKVQLPIAPMEISDEEGASEGPESGDPNAQQQAVPRRWLSSQKPPTPPGKWKAADINPIEFQNPAKVRDSLGSDVPITPFGLFNTFFDETVISHIVEMTNLYASRDKGINLSTNSDEIRILLAIFLLSG